MASSLSRVAMARRSCSFSNDGGGTAACGAWSSYSDAALFLLRHVEGLSNEELAAMFQLEKNNVAVRLHRIRHRLQAEMAR